VNIKRGRLYLADLNPRFGTEAGKSRPVVVIQTDHLNEIGHPSTWILPCTTRLTPRNILRVSLPTQIAGNDHECDVMIDQSRVIDNKRFVRMLGIIPQIIFEEIEEKLRQVGGLQPPAVKEKRDEKNRPIGEDRSKEIVELPRLKEKEEKEDG